jgi:hypothetical protein
MAMVATVMYITDWLSVDLSGVGNRYNTVKALTCCNGQGLGLVAVSLRLITLSQLKIAFIVDTDDTCLNQGIDGPIDVPQG